MDGKKYMVIDTSRQGLPEMFITLQVEKLELSDGMWRVKFNTSGVTYKYRYERIRFLSDPEKIDVGRRGVYLRNRRVNNIRELYRFSDGEHSYYHVVCDNGNEFNYEEKGIYVSKTTLDECGGDLWKYLNHLASETGLEIDGVGNILKIQYDMVDRMRDNGPLARYIREKTRLAEYNINGNVLYPFGCNASQKQGVENALTHQVSIIQGPPGTGKTQTILNIIANLLACGKNVLVVSNNNSAVENVAEKLSDPETGLGFLVAQLGNQDNKAAFIANQSALPVMGGWIVDDERSLADEITAKLQAVSNGFKAQTRLAGLKIELEALKTESRYNDLLESRKSSESGWLGRKPSRRLLELKLMCDKLLSQDKKPGLMFCLKWMFRFGTAMWRFLHLPADEISKEIDAAYYMSRSEEIRSGIEECEACLSEVDMDANMKALRGLSLKMLKHRIAVRRNGFSRQVFTAKDIKPRSEEFLREYPVVLSTTHAAKNCISADMTFDYVIMDEASQVDICTGALALSCADNAVIVGDDKQLPNVVKDGTKKILNMIENAYEIEDRYRSSIHSFLQSCCEVFSEAPQTLLREHYRCHPKIIEFCNRMFYDGQLITMTQDRNEEDVLSAVMTVKGNHARGYVNQREIDVIQAEVMPKLNGCGSVGIIAPYRDQANAINKQLGGDMASTVHKFQGRECENIVMSMVDNDVSTFSDDPNLLNVAVSRAKSRLVVVANGNGMSSRSNLGQLIDYIRYNNFEVADSCLHSVFDLLYKQYSLERMKFEEANGGAEGELAENLVYKALEKSIRRLGMASVIDVVKHYPLSRIFAVESMSDEEEKRFVSSDKAHVDLLVFNSVTRRPLMCIEVDGWKYHRVEVQQKRDKIKDALFEKYGLPLIRISTVQTITEDRICDLLVERIVG